MTRTGAEFQSSREPVTEQDRRYGLNPKTTAKWRDRDYVQNAPRSATQALYKFKRQLFYDSLNHLALRPYSE